MFTLVQQPLYEALLIASALVSVAIPVVFVGVRETTKLQRRRIVDDLSIIFERDGEFGPVAIPSFEFVKYKYKKSSRRDKDQRRDFAWYHWLLSAVPLAAYLFVMNAVSLVFILHAGFKVGFAELAPWLATGEALPLFAWVLLASHVGGLLFTLRAFKQAVNNFDMSPLSLVGAIVNLAFGPAVALLIAFSAFKLLDNPLRWQGETSFFPIVVVTAFAAGYYPEVATRYLVDFSRLRRFKKVDADIYCNFKAIPIEVIDGIDVEIRARLDDYHLSSVQNLAAANPLMLFVETPYGVYEIMDWVAQAQLCSSVGPNALIELWKLGIRTIFDLERVALDVNCRDDALVAQIGDILWSTDEHATARKTGVAATKTVPHPPLSAVEANIRMRIANPHALRLRQIFNQVSYSLGSDARRLPRVDGRRSDGPGPFAKRLVSRRPFRRRSPGPLAAVAWAFFVLWCALA